MKKIIPSLNGLRALSIFFVLIGHVEYKSLKVGNDAPGAQIGVTIFFVLSGFLITYLLIKEENNNGQISLKNFYVRRALRIFPVYYVLLLVYFILQQLNILQFSTASWVTSLTYTKYFRPGEWESGHLWSLSVEEHFYLIWPVVFYFFKSYRVYFALAIITIIPFVRLSGHVSTMHLFSRGDALMWGCLLAIYYDPIVSYIKSKSNLLLGAPFAVLVLCLVAKRIITLFFHTQGHLENVAIAFAGSFGTLSIICIGLIIIISVNYTDNLWFKFLNLRWMSYIGILSYSIYIWQQVFFSTKVGAFSRFPFNIIYIVIVALISYNFIELPFLKLKNRFESGKKNTSLKAVTPASMSTAP